MLIDIYNRDQNLFNNVIKFFTAVDTSPEYFVNIKTALVEWSFRMNTTPSAFWNLGYLSTDDFLNYMTHIGMPTGGIRIADFIMIIDALEKNHIIHRVDGNSLVKEKKLYKSNGPRTKFLYDRGLIHNAILGWQFIIERYKRSVFKIINNDVKGQPSIGTGFYFAASNEQVVKTVIITNRHVIGNQNIEVEDISGAKIDFKNIVCDSTLDLAFIILAEQLDIPAFHFNGNVNVLSDIITIGYPAIPLTREAYQVYHKGEINGHVKDYFGHETFLFSAKTSPGNSGSPIIDSNGMVCGIVTQEFFEKEKFKENGQLPYYSAYSANLIIESFNANY